jgi:hypothetical protein
MMLRTPVCSYPIIVTHLSFNFLCLLLLYSIYLNDSESEALEQGVYKEMLLTNRTPSTYMSPKAGGGGGAGSQPMRTAVHLT